MKIKILGPGCIHCLKLELLAAQAGKELGLEVEIEKVADRRAFLKFNVEPPALVAEGRVLYAGLPLPIVEKIMQLLKSA